MVGPPIGGFVYGFLGYQGTFYFFSVVIIGSLIIQIIYIPSTLNFP